MGGSLLYLRGTMQGHKRGEGKSKPKTGLRSLGRGKGTERGGSGRVEMWSSENGN